jgi:hypothetical protein
MTNPTSSFGWVMPSATDLVTDLPADFEVFGQAVDTDFAGLLGGTTGQVLAKASGTDLDFVWSADAAGMTNPMTTTGDIIYSSPGSTPVRLPIGADGQVLTSDGSVVNWETPASSPLTTAGDLYTYTTGDDRLPIGSEGQILTVSSGAPVWASAGAAAVNYSLISTTTLSGASTTISGLSGYNTLFITINGMVGATGYQDELIFNNDTSAKYNSYGLSLILDSSYSVANFEPVGNTLSPNYFNISENNGSTYAYGGIEIDGANSAGIKTVKINTAQSTTPSGARDKFQYGNYVGTSVISSIKFTRTGGSYSGGVIKIYGSAV